MKTRDERVDELLALFTCPHCGEIRERDKVFNSVRVCFICHGRACAGNPPLIKAAARAPEARPQP